ncbi:MAG: xanthine dehydrogenase family protein [Deltaproteobacteria bacterium]|nr:xanthine dehydrogenase family protein [Deltaproteobacteria bacterium]
MADARLYVGQNVPRVDGVAKVTGAAKYLDDLHLPDMLHGATVRSEVARGRLTGLAVDPWLAEHGVTVVTAEDVPENVVALIEDDQPVLVREHIRHRYEPVALVACERKEDLQRALAGVRQTVTPEAPVLSLDDALRAESPVHGPDNIQKRYRIVKGDVDRARQEPGLVFTEGTYHVHHQEHLYIEPQGVIAWWDASGVHVLGSIQCPYYVHKALKRALKVTDTEAHVTQTVTGGGFGGKEEYPSMIALHAALLAKKSGRPVKVVYGRGEDMEATTRRHPARVKITSGARSDGTLAFLDIDVLMDGGAYVTLTPVVLSRGTLHATGPYRCPDVRVVARALATNTPPNGAFRGFGAPQTIWAIERHMDRLADQLGIEREALRRHNLFVEGDVTATGQTLKVSVGGMQCLDAAVKASDYYAKRAQYASEGVQRAADGRRVRRGIGLSTFFHGAGFTGSGERRLKGRVQVDLEPGGSLRVRSASTDIGQGTETVFAQLAAQAARVPFARVAVEQPCTTHVPDSGPTVASRTVMVVGSIVELAARDVAERVRADVARHHAVAPERVTHGDDSFTGPFGEESFAVASDRLLGREPRVVSLRQFEPPADVFWDDDTYTGEAYPAYSWGCDIAAVEVDVDTLETRVTDFWAAQDVGKAIHPVLCAGQVEGGSLQAVGWAVSEALVWQDGAIKNARMTNYIIPTSLDAPRFHTTLIEVPYPGGPFGAKGVGELPMDGGAPAVASAVEQATGLALDALPLLPEDLLRAQRNGAPQ